MGGCCQSRDHSPEKSFSIKEANGIRAQFEAKGQSQVFTDFDKLSFEDQQVLLKEAHQLDLDQVNQLYQDLVIKGEGHTDEANPG